MKPSALNKLFHVHDVQHSGQLTMHQLAKMFNDIRVGGISVAQVAAAMEYICGTSDLLVFDELKSVLEEMDRRYFLVQDLQWEFALLDNEHKGAISVGKARFLFQAVHGNMFSESHWRRFLSQRVLSDAPVPFSEIEVDLCSRPTPDYWDLLETQAPRLPNYDEEHDKEKDRLQKKQDRRMKEEQRRKREEERRLKEERIRKQEQKKKREEMLEAQKIQMKEHSIENSSQQANNITMAVADAEKEELRRQETQKASQELKEKMIEREKERKEEEQKEMQQKEENERNKKKALKAARKKERAAAHQEVYDKLEHAMESKDETLLEPAIKQYKDQVRKRDHDELLSEAERLLEMLRCSGALKDAMAKRMISDLERAIEKARKSGFDQSEQDLAKEVATADDLLLRLRRLERLRSEVLELKQATIAEIRSYQKPMSIIHSIMIATYLLLGVPESQTKKWPNVQMLLGRTGKEGLKRRISQCNVINIQVATATRARNIIGEVDLEAIRDVSAGAATFFVWAEGMIDEVLANEKE